MNLQYYNFPNPVAISIVRFYFWFNFLEVSDFHHWSYQVTYFLDLKIPRIQYLLLLLKLCIMFQHQIAIYKFTYFPIVKFKRDLDLLLNPPTNSMSTLNKYQFDPNFLPVRRSAQICRIVTNCPG